VTRNAVIARIMHMSYRSKTYTWNEVILVKRSMIRVFLISPVYFSSPICPILFQFTTHQLSNIRWPLPILQLPTVQFCLFPCYSRFLQTKYLPQPLFCQNISVFSRCNNLTCNYNYTWRITIFYVSTLEVGWCSAPRSGRCNSGNFPAPIKNEAGLHTSG